MGVGDVSGRSRRRFRTGGWWEPSPAGGGVGGGVGGGGALGPSAVDVVFAQQDGLEEAFSCPGDGDVFARHRSRRELVLVVVALV